MQAADDFLIFSCICEVFSGDFVIFLVPFCFGAMWGVFICFIVFFIFARVLEGKSKLSRSFVARYFDYVALIGVSG